MQRWLAILAAAILLAATATAFPEHIEVISPVPTEYNVVNGTILLHIETNYVVPNTKYSVTAEIEKNKDCKGCYDVYLVLHTPETPGYAWHPHKLAPILATIKPGATEENVRIRVIPLGALKNAATAVERAERCGALRAEVAKISAEIDGCKIMGCDENAVEQIREEWARARADNIKMRCGIALPPPPQAKSIEPEINVAVIVSKYVKQDAHVERIREQNGLLQIYAIQRGKILGVIPVTVRTTIEVWGERVAVKQPWWFSILRWIIW